MQAAANASQAHSPRPTPLPLRDDTLLGVCEGLGEEFGFNPNYLRIVVGSLVLFDITLAVVAYLGLGLALAIGRLMFPPNSHPVAKSAAGQPVAQANDSAAAPETLAA